MKRDGVVPPVGSGQVHEDALPHHHRQQVVRAALQGVPGKETLGSTPYSHSTPPATSFGAFASSANTLK